MSALLHDLRFSFRQVRKNPMFTAIAALTLALGIGANTAIFSVVYATLLAPLPYRNPDQLVMVWSKVNGHNNSVSAGDFLDWKSQNSVFQDLIAWSSTTFSLSASGELQALQARITSPNFFSMQGIPLFLGREFLREEGTPGKDHVVIITHRLWRERFGGDLHIIGQQLRLNGEPYTVVGVLAPGMPDRFESHLFVPLAFKPEQINHDAHWLAVMGRLKSGITLPQAQADMDTVANRIASVYPVSNRGWGVSIQQLQNAFTGRNTIKNLWLLMGAVGFVLFIACVNVANLLLARSTARQKEVAIRSALGARRKRILSQFLTESLVLALIGGILGTSLAWALLKVILALLPPFSIPTEADIRLSLPVLFFTLAASLLAGVLCGCAPAFQIAGRNLSDTLKEGGRAVLEGGTRSLRRALVVVEFALALALLAGGGLAIHSFWKLNQVDLGFRQDHILTFGLPIRPNQLINPEQINAFYRELLQKIQSLPGVSSAAASTGMPILGTNFGRPFTIAGQSAGDRASRPGAGFTMVTPGYFQTFGIQMIRGRTFNERDAAGGVPVAIVNESFANKYLANVDPLTQRIVVEQLVPGASRPGPPIEWQVVGIYRDVRNGGVRSEGFPEMNVPFWQSPWPTASVEVRTVGDPAGMANSIATVIRTLDSNLALDRVRTMDQIVDESLAGDRFATVLFATFAIVALILAVVGIYGVMSFAVAQRTHEIGLRIALGASPGKVLRLVVGEGTLLALIGLTLGLGGAYFVGRAMKSVLYEVGAMDPLSVVLVALVLLLSALVACYVPARRAMRVDPLVALRQE
jgi:putative ABC transport system permease protein